MRELFFKAVFVFRFRFVNPFFSSIYIFFLSWMGVSIGKNTMMERARFTWYHKVKIGNGCTIEKNVFFKYDGPFTEGYAIVIADQTFIGNGCEFNISDSISIGFHGAIASGCKFIDHNHGFDNRDKYIGEQAPTSAPILIEDDVWLGANVLILKGVHIGKGAIVAASSVVNKSIGAYEIWGGVPAKKLSDRL